MRLWVARVEPVVVEQITAKGDGKGLAIAATVVSSPVRSLVVDGFACTHACMHAFYIKLNGPGLKVDPNCGYETCSEKIIYEM